MSINTPEMYAAMIMIHLTTFVPFRIAKPEPNHAPIELEGPHVIAQAMLLHRGYAGD